MREILITGMKMPKEGFIRLIIEPNGTVKEINLYNETVIPTEAKAIEVPTHGRLINAYSLAVKVAEAQDRIRGKEYDPFMLLGDVLRWIELEPTIIAANTSTDRFCNTEGCSNSKPDMSKAQNHICPYYQGVCSLDENILCYCEHHYEMCDKFIKVIKEKE